MPNATVEQLAQVLKQLSSPTGTASDNNKTTSS
jgi:hypothetical protein